MNQAAKSSSRYIVNLAVAMIGIHVSLLAWNAWRDSPTVDEVAFLPAGISHWQLGRFDLFRVNPPLVRMTAALPLLAADVHTNWRSITSDPRVRMDSSIGQQFLAMNREHVHAFFTLARWACIPFSILGACTCFRWAGELYGPLASAAATAFWCFSPDILGHAHLITADVPASAIGITAIYFFWHWLKMPAWTCVFCAGLLFGLALLTKSTWIILFVLWPFCWICWTLLERQRPCSTCFKEGLRLVGIFGLALCVLNLGYGFEGLLQPLGSFRFVSRTLGGPQSDRIDHDPTETPLNNTTSTFANTGNRFAETWLGALPVPFPKNFIQGIDVQKAFFERGVESYLRGKLWDGRGWSYYLYALVVKIPVGTWMLVLLVVAARLSGGISTSLTRDELILFLHFLALFYIVGSQGGKHLRYLFPVYPLAFIWISQSASWLAGKNWKLAAAATVAIVYSITSSLAAYPHTLSYFNELVGGPINGHFHLGASNVDWGQNLLRLKDWVQQNPDAQPLYIGFIHPNSQATLTGIDFLPLQPPSSDPNKVSELWLNGGWCAVSSVALHRQHLEFLLHRQAVTVIGYTIFIYNLTPDDVKKIRKETALPP